MARSKALRAALLAPLLLAAAGCSHHDAGPRAANVVLIVVDTLRADRLSCYGYGRATSPAIDRLAAGGLLLRANRSQSCWTLPSMISLFSGSYFAGRVTSLPAERPTLAERVHAAGYATAAFVGNKAISEDLGFDRGFGHFASAEVHHAGVLVEQLKAWHAATAAERAGTPGFFVWLHPYDPHFPYTPRAGGFQGPRPGEAELERRWRALGTPEASALASIRSASNSYDDEVAAVDAAVGALVGWLEQQGLRESTLIILAADHGEMLWEHPAYPQDLQVAKAGLAGRAPGLRELFMQGHRAWFQREVWNTPLILAGPGVPPGASDDLSANLDIYPTVLDFLGLSPPPGLEGRSLLAAGAPRDRVFAHGFGTDAVAEKDGLELFEHPPERFLLPPDAERPLELFDLARDPAEVENLAAARAQEAARLRAELAGWRSAHPAGAERGFTERTLGHLKDLGYAGDTR